MDRHDAIATLSVWEDKTDESFETIQHSALFVPPQDLALKLPNQARIDITLDTVPKYPSGITFGWGSWCDIVLPKHSSISEHHFSLIFDQGNRLVVRDWSTNGTEVTYNGHGMGFHAGKQWILNDPNMPDSFRKIEISVARLILFRVKIHLMSSDEPRYIQAVNRFRSVCGGEGPLLLQLKVAGIRQTSAGSMQSAPPTEDIWLRCPAGEGTSGNVVRYWNPQDGSQKAVKKPPLKADYEEDRWNHEAELLRRIHHHHVVKLITYMPPDEYSSPEIHLEYLGGGTLEDSNTLSPLRRQEVVAILYQCLTGLVHLHSRSPAIVHRDIKPDNIMINTRNEESICVKITDLGAANTETPATTWGLNSIYSAPEAADADGCNPTLDIWSIGITVLRFLDEEIQGQYCKTGDVDWLCSELDQSKDELIKFLRRHMLVLNASGRSTASTCLDKLRELQDFDGLAICPCITSGECSASRERLAPSANGQDSLGPPTPTLATHMPLTSGSCTPTEEPTESTSAPASPTNTHGTSTPRDIMTPAEDLQTPAEDLPTPALTRDTSVATSLQTLDEASPSAEVTSSASKRRRDSQDDPPENKRAKWASLDDGAS